MAVSQTHQCDYVVSLTHGRQAVASSVQSKDVPGLAGSSPRIEIEDDGIRVVSDAAERAMPAWTQWLALSMLVVPPLGVWLNRRWHDRQSSRAQARELSFSTPGIAEQLKAGMTLRIRARSDRDIDVTLHDGDVLIASWQPKRLVVTPW